MNLADTTVLKAGNAFLVSLPDNGLRIAGASVDLLFTRAVDGEHVALADASVDGDVEVVLEIAGADARLPAPRADL